MLPEMTKEERDFFWQKIVRVGEPGDCWDLRHPTAMVPLGKQNGLYDPYRVAYFLHTGDDPGHIEIEQRCNNWRCCNPYHLQLVFNRAMEERCLAAYDDGDRMTLRAYIQQLQRQLADADKTIADLRARRYERDA